MATGLVGAIARSDFEVNEGGDRNIRFAHILVEPRHGDTEIVFDPENLGTIDGALRILHKPANRVVVYQNGTLEVEF